jgi:hypothetical protein
MATFSDAFGGTLANWTSEAGSQSIVGGQLSMDTGGFGENWLIYTGTACDGLSQYLKATVVVGMDGGNNFPQFIFRFTNDASPFYSVDVHNDAGDDNDITWAVYPSVGGSSTEIQNAEATITNGDTVGVTVDGTGTDTVVNVWINPTGDAPTSASLWGGAGPLVSFTNNPATAADTGTLLGLGAFHNDAVTFDNFFGGDIGGGGGGVAKLTPRRQFLMGVG